MSAAGSRSASAQKRAKIVAFFSDPVFVAETTTRFGRRSDSIDPPLALVVTTTSCRVEGTRSNIAAISGPEGPPPGC